MKMGLFPLFIIAWHSWTGNNVGYFNRVQNYNAESSLSTVFGNPVYVISKFT